MKMDRRKKRTSTNQYMMYIGMMEKDPIFASGRLPRDVDINYLQNKWKELSDKLNTCSSGPTLTAEEWKKRLSDWKNTTRCKYRRSVASDEISMTSLELKALNLFGKTPNVSMDRMSGPLKCEKIDNESEMDHQRTSESFQKELAAAVEEAISGNDGDMINESDEQEEVLPDSLPVQQSTSENNVASGGTTTYRTIVVDNAQYTDGDDNEEIEYIGQRRQTSPSSSSVISQAALTSTGVQTVATSSPAVTMTKLINGDVPAKRSRTYAPDHIIYEVKKAIVPQQLSTNQRQRTITIHNAGVQHHQSEAINGLHNANPHQSTANATTMNLIGSSADSREISRQLKRLADIKAEKLKFEVARFKYNNPGFIYHLNSL